MIKYQAVFHPEDWREWQILYEEDTLIGRAIAGFREFSQDYKDYFDGIISEGKFDYSKTTADRLRSRVLQALEDYWAPLGEVAMQCQIEHYRGLLADGTAKAQTYLDKLESGLSDVLIYFNKVAAIKYCPYTSIPFIGTPYTLSVAGDWMAIPHELGHHLYWNLGVDFRDTRRRHRAIEKEAAKKLKERGVPESHQTMLLSWLEETFCDVVGTRIGGVEFVTRFEDFMKSRAGNTDELTANDGSHPPLCLRPFVREHALKLNGGASGGDWSGFFNRAFGKGVSELNLEASPPNFEDMIREMTKEELLRMLEPEESPETTTPTQFQPLPLAEIIPAMEVLVEYLYTQIDDSLLAFGKQPSTHETHSFGQLLDLAIEDSSSQGKPPYEILLRPRILEGGYEDEPHSCWAHWSWDHMMGVHYHS